MITLRARRERARIAATNQWLADTAPGAVVYFTDGVDLYRVNRWLDRPTGPTLVEVENCRSLDCVLLSCDDLARLSVRQVAVDVAIEAAAARSLTLAGCPQPEVGGVTLAAEGL